MDVSYECLYSKDLRKKRKTFCDGRLHVRNGIVSLYSEDETKIATSRAPSDLLLRSEEGTSRL